MIAVISLLVVILTSIIVVRIGAVALEMTGLSKETAIFQAQSAFSGTGFTTSESEYVVSHPVRRKIIRTLIFIGNIGIASAMATLILTFVGQSGDELTTRTIWLVIGLFAIFLFARSKMINKGMRWLIRRALERFTRLRIYDYEQILGLSKGYSIGEFKIKRSSWLRDKTLEELRLDKEGVIVLAIYRKVGEKEKFIGAPDRSIKILGGDTLICYGPEEAVKNLSRRLKGRAGDEEHREAVRNEETRKEREKIEINQMEEEIRRIFSKIHPQKGR
ncbi:MAG TPA: potassium transporter TrkA [Thermoplasmatales archaeon]|nr:potassium transporter TrkA [Thermoplasmatales archaeon]